MMSETLETEPELYVELSEYPGYFVSNMGHLRNRRGHILKCREDHDGGQQVGRGIGLIAANFGHHIADGVRPAANLGADIEELPQYPTHKISLG